MSNVNEKESNANSNVKQEQLEPEYSQEDIQKHNDTMDLINGVSNAQFLRLPAESGGSVILQFLKDKRSFWPVEREFEDTKTGDKRKVTRINYRVIDPEHKDEGEKEMNVSLTLAKQIEGMKKEGYYLLKLIREGTGLRTKFQVIPKLV